MPIGSWVKKRIYTSSHNLKTNYCNLGEQHPSTISWGTLSHLCNHIIHYGVLQKQWKPSNTKVSLANLIWRVSEVFSPNESIGVLEMPCFSAIVSRRLEIRDIERAINVFKPKKVPFDLIVAQYGTKNYYFCFKCHFSQSYVVPFSGH